MNTKTLSVLLTLAGPASLIGQAPAPVKVGSDVRITLKSSRRFEARLVRLTTDSLQWQEGYGPGAPRGAVARDSIALWEVRRPGAGPIGGVIGLAVGAGIGAIAASREHSDPPCNAGWFADLCHSLSKSTKQKIDVVVSAALGTIFGALIGSRVRRTTWTPVSLGEPSAGSVGLGLHFQF
jgi:hypothetical protein